jgi:hypothetical protein
MVVNVICWGILCFWVLVQPVLAAEQLSIGTTVDVSHGNYGATSATDLVATTLQGKYTVDDLSLQINVPYLMLSGPSQITAVSDTALIVPQTNAQHREIEGIGDILLGALYNTLYDPDLGIAIDIGFKLKIPTADYQAGLGSGEPDEALQLYAYKSLADFTFMLAAGYKWVGQPVDHYYRNTINGSAGLIYQLSENASLGTIFDMRQSIFSTLDDQIEVTLYGAYKLSNAWRAQLYVYKGCTETSPDIGLGSMLNYRF